MKQTIFDSVGYKKIEMDGTEYVVFVKAILKEDKDSVGVDEWELLASFPFVEKGIKKKVIKAIDNTFWMDTFVWDKKRLEDVKHHVIFE